MGLDWRVLEKPIRGHEAEFADLVRVHLVEREAWTPESEARYQAISTDAADTLGVPRVGREPEADAWLREQFDRGELRQRVMDRSQKDPILALRTIRYVPFESFEAALRHYHNRPVWELVADKGPEFPRYSNGVISFRGQFLVLAADHGVPDDILGGAYTTMLSHELADFGGRLRAFADVFAAEHGCTEVLGVRNFRPADGADPTTTPAGIAHVADQAARWCLAWSSRGHGMAADY